MCPQNIRLIDYEKLTDDKGQRVVAFGKWAGVAGIINIFHGLGLRLLALGHHTPFMHIAPAHNYRNSSMAIQAIRDAGYEISMGMMPRSMGPLTVVFTGSGNVSQGAQEIFQELPHEYVNPSDLKEVALHGSINKLYGTVVSRDDHFQRKEGGGFDPEEFENFPERYYSTFATKIAPYASVIVNGIYWAVNSPKLLTIPDAKRLLQPSSTPWLPVSEGTPSLPHRLLALCDISADPGGSIEFMTECTTIDTPFCLYDADQHQNSERGKTEMLIKVLNAVYENVIKVFQLLMLLSSFAGPGVLVCSIDNMPTQLPREATDFFGDLLFPFVADFAIIASNGQLTPNFQYIQELRKTSKECRSRQKAQSLAAASKKRVLVLGAGYVAAPLVEYLSRDKSTEVVIASALQQQGEALAAGQSNTECVVLDVVKRPETLEKLVAASDLVVSLLPYGLHPEVARSCIRHRVNMVTASYLTPAMRDLQSAAEEAGITIVNEVGLDPGIDHLLAMECFDNAKMNGGKVQTLLPRDHLFSFYITFYIQSHLWMLRIFFFLISTQSALRDAYGSQHWSPRGVLANTLAMAKYMQNGEVKEIPAGGALLDAVVPMDFLPGFNLEGFPNRDSLIYRDIYGIPSAHTVLRGTLRYQGFSRVVQGLHRLGLISAEPHPSLHPQGPEISWKEFLSTSLGHQGDLSVPNVRNLIYDTLGQDESLVVAMEQLGLIDEEPVNKMGSPLDTLTHLLANKLAFRVAPHQPGGVWGPRGPLSHGQDCGLPGWHRCQDGVGRGDPDPRHGAAHGSGDIPSHAGSHQAGRYRRPGGGLP
ncbi:AASS [Cordylochernes scorpioides]|uniref:AASS n=1 Tax=Cordylochernes scorpioides TaxID=51811 RepID=A0ABY6LCU1_9ARAC|nr:AASS [Cordylochernes scorpioides]